jgi:hypothetical protein
MHVWCTGNPDTVLIQYAVYASPAHGVLCALASFALAVPALLLCLILPIALLPLRQRRVDWNVIRYDIRCLANC